MSHLSTSRVSYRLCIADDDSLLIYHHLDSSKPLLDLCLRVVWFLPGTLWQVASRPHGQLFLSPSTTE